MEQTIAFPEGPGDDGRVGVSLSVGGPVDARRMHQAALQKRQRVAAASGEGDDPESFDPPELGSEKSYRGIAPGDHETFLDSRLALAIQRFAAKERAVMRDRP
jgi:hypothetical protein